MPDVALALIPFILFFTLVAGLWLILAYMIPTLVVAGHRAARAWTRWIVRVTGLERLLAHATRTIPRWKVYLPVVLVLIVGILASFGAGAVFLDLAEDLTEEDGELQETDQRLYKWARDLRAVHVTPFFTTLTIIGTPVGLGIIVAIVVVLLAMKKHSMWIVYLLVTTVVGGGINKLLKAFFARERPEVAEMLRETTGYSFPSGHAMGSTLVFGALIYIAFRYFRTGNQRAFWAAFCLSMIIAISFSRIYLGVHWTSDIIAGITAGTTWVFATTGSYEVLRRARRLRGLGHEREQRQDRISSRP